MMQSLTPNLMVEDVRAAIEFYERLGFEVRMAVPEDESGIHEELLPDEQYSYAQLTAGDVEIMVEETESLRADVPALADQGPGASLTLYVAVDDLEALYESVAGDVDVVSEPAVTWYGMREFYVRTPNGYVFGFGEQTGEPPQ